MSQEFKKAAWNKKVETIFLELPSSTPEEPVVFEVKKRRLAPLARMKMMPSDLLKKVMGGGVDQKDLTAAENAEAAMMTLKIQDFVIRSVVAPKIILEGEPQENECLLEDMEQEDLEYLMKYFLGTKEAEELEDFRNGSAGPHPGPDVQAVQSSPV